MGIPTSSLQQRRWATAYLLANGWFIDDCAQSGGQTVSDMGALFVDNNEAVNMLFPNHGQADRSGFEAWIRTNFVRSMPSVLGISNEAAQRIYGTAANGRIIEATNMSYGVGRLYWFLFHPTGIQHTNERYVGAHAGESVQQVYIFDTIVLGYALASYTAQAQFLEWVLSTGLLNYLGQEESRRMFDPHNPAHILQNRGHGFNPAGAGPALTDAVYIMRELGEDPQRQSEATMRQLEVLMQVRGGLYDQRYRTSAGTREIFYSTRNPGVWWEPRGSLAWNPATMEGVPVTDCSSLTMHGLNLGGDRGGFSTSMHLGLIGLTSRTADLHGRQISNYLVRVLPDGTMDCTTNPPLSNGDYKPLGQWTQHLQPGDIILKQGHIGTVLGVNRTGSTVIIPAQLTGSSGDLRVEAGHVVTISTGRNSQPTRVQNYTAWNDIWIPLRPAFSSHAVSCS